MSDERRLAQQQAIRLLAQREYSRQELGTRISRKHALNDSELNDLLDELEQSGYLDDQRYAEMFVRSSVLRGQGPLKIAYALRDKGVAEALARAALDDAGTDWLEQARYQRKKKFGEAIPANFKERARQSRFLAGRGFSIDIINAVFHEKC
ncbi:MAG: RecX family transcriptional regulator [Thiothrix nivea]|nr:MAG: RecX family transcriptional regulator [Thiothrix nivea]